MPLKPELASARPRVTEALRLALEPGEQRQQARSDLLTTLWSIARAGGFRLGDLHWQSCHDNFHWIELNNNEHRSVLLLHAEAPVAATAAPFYSGSEPSFLEDPSFAAAVRQVQAPLRLLAASELRQDLTEADQEYIRGLGREHAYNLAYWKPRTVGSVIFNGWD